MLPRTKVLMSVLLLMSVAAMLISPTMSQVNPPQAKSNHTTSHGHQQQSTTTTTSSETHPRHGTGVPPGLTNAWAQSHMSVVAWAVTHAIFLNGTHGVMLAWIAINASSNGQRINSLNFNGTVLQIELDHDGDVELSANSSAKPTAVYADDRELSEVPSTFGLTPSSEAWAFDESTHVLTVFADPSTVTIFYGSTPTREFSSYVGALAGVIILAMASILIYAKKRPKE